MESFISQVFNLLIAPPGNLAYYVVLAFTVVGALQSSINHWRHSGFPQGNRMVAGLSGLLILQLVQFAIAGLAWQGVLKPETWLPPVDRMIGLVSLVIIVWLWLVPEPAGLADVAFSLVLFLALTWFTLILLSWRGQAAEVYFNASWMDWGTNWFAMVLLVMGAFGLLVRRPNSWGIGLAMLFLLFMGQFIQFILPQANSDYSGPMRLAQLMAFPWLLALPQRFPVPASDTTDRTETKTPMVAERRRYNADPKMLQEFVGLIGLAEPERLCEAVSRVVSQVMLADFCLLVLPPGEGGTMTVACGYNLIEEKPVEGFPIDGRLAPMISSAFRRNKPLRLPASSTSSDLQALSQGLHLSQVGHLLAVPIPQADQPPIMDLILLLPYSKRGWSVDDQDVLLALTRYLAIVFQRHQKGDLSTDDVQQLKNILDATQESKQELLAQLEAAQDQLMRERQRAESLSAFINAQDETVVVLPELQDAPADSSKAEPTPIGEAISEADQVSRQAFEELQADLRLALEQVADMRAELAQAEHRQALAPFSVPTESVVSAPHQPSSPQPVPDVDTLMAPAPSQMETVMGLPGSPSGKSEDVASIVQDMRQPLSSILGYANLLLGESVGILGALQRKFLERIRASAERMGGMTDDLVQLTALEESTLKLKPQLVHLEQAIQAAVSAVKQGLDQKEIQLHMDIAEKLPELRADLPALNQVLLSLLQNASNCSPIKGEIHLKARAEAKDHEPGYILIQVTDSGDGIPLQELPRVFSRMYKPEPADQTQPCPKSIDLATVKALVEAHGGRIWVDSTVGQGSTFSTLLPVMGELEGE